MAGRRLILALIAVMLLPAAAHAQANTGFATAFIGAARAGDITESGWTPGAAVVIVDERGLGAELDGSYVSEFDHSRFVESGITTLMLNVTGIFLKPPSIVRPYVTGGVGLLRTRVCVNDCSFAVTHADVGMDIGAGVFVLLNEMWGARGDVRYFRDLQTHGDLPLAAPGKFEFWRISIGATLSWPMP